MIMIDIIKDIIILIIVKVLINKNEKPREKKEEINDDNDTNSERYNTNINYHRSLPGRLRNPLMIELETKIDRERPIQVKLKSKMRMVLLKRSR